MQTANAVVEYRAIEQCDECGCYRRDVATISRGFLGRACKPCRDEYLSTFQAGMLQIPEGFLEKAAM